MIKLIVFILAAAPLVVAQNSVTVTASRNTAAPPDQVVFGADVLTDFTSSRDDVLAVLQGSMLTAANFSYVRTVQQFLSNGNQSMNKIAWTFQVTAPIGNFKTTVAQLTALQQIVAQKKNGMSLSFYVLGTGVSAQASQGSNCSTADLVADARAQAQKLAVAAGAGVGSVLAMSGATVSQPADSGLFGGVGMTVPVCSLTVKFALTGF